VNWLFRRGVADVKTARLRLVAITPPMMAAEQLADGSLAKVLNARLTHEWPPEHWEPHVFEFILKQFEDKPATLGWHRYVLLPDARGRGRTLIGAVGGFPKPEGDVEIGYSTLPEFQRLGYATEAAGALVEWLMLREGVRSVSAQTFPRLPESIKVMERCGMTFVGDGDDEGTVRYRRMR
jgi:[ribosomal protein S5]-alanine N-acetyltransferase